MNYLRKQKLLPWEELYSEERKVLGDEGMLLSKSKLFSPSDIQSIMKKAMVERLKTDLRDRMVPGGWSGLSGACISDER